MEANTGGSIFRAARDGSLRGRAAIKHRREFTEPVLGIDPGRTNGLALVNVDGELVRSATVQGLVNLYTTLEEWNPSTVVVEDFFGGRARDARDPFMAIGVITLWAESYRRYLHFQVPSYQVRWEGQVRAAHSNPHIRSAMAHALNHMWKYSKAPRKQPRTKLTKVPVEPTRSSAK